MGRVRAVVDLAGVVAAVLAGAGLRAGPGAEQVPEVVVGAVALAALAAPAVVVAVAVAVVAPVVAAVAAVVDARSQICISRRAPQYGARFFGLEPRLAGTNARTGGRPVQFYL